MSGRGKPSKRDHMSNTDLNVSGEMPLRCGLVYAHLDRKRSASAS